MKRLLLVAILVASVAVSIPDSAQAEGRDVAAGGGQLIRPLTTVTFGFGANSGPLGEDARGGMHYASSGNGAEVPAFQAEATVECLVVVGNRAAMAGRITNSQNLSNPFDMLFFVVEDNGNPADGVDRFIGGFDFSQNLTGCQSLALTQQLLFPVDNGNITVRDAAP